MIKRFNIRAECFDRNGNDSKDLPFISLIESQGGSYCHFNDYAAMRELCDDLALALEFYKKENETAVECGLLEPDIVMPAAQALDKYKKFIKEQGE